MVQTGNNRVMVTSAELDAFAAKWPCSGLRSVDMGDRTIAVDFEFDSNGDLTGINWYDLTDNVSTGIDINEPAGVDPTALLALSQDAAVWLQTHGTRDGW